MLGEPVGRHAERPLDDRVVVVADTIGASGCGTLGSRSRISRSSWSICVVWSASSRSRSPSVRLSAMTASALSASPAARSWPTSRDSSFTRRRSPSRSAAKVAQAGVERSCRVELIEELGSMAAGHRSPDPVRVGAEQSNVDHRVRSVTASIGRPGSICARTVSRTGGGRRARSEAAPGRRRPRCRGHGADRPA